MCYTSHRMTPEQVVERMERMRLSGWTEDELLDGLTLFETYSDKIDYTEQINLLKNELGKR
jgi:hypothetical protein